jgi:quinol monooxygenase YgiN
MITRFQTSIRRLALVAGAALLLAAHATPSAAQNQQGSPNMVFALFNIVPIKEQANETHSQDQQANIRGARGIQGNISFEVFRAQDTPTDLFFVEIWDDKAALDRHLASAHFKVIKDRLPADLNGQVTSLTVAELTPTLRDVRVAAPASTYNIISQVTVPSQSSEAFGKAALETALAARSASGNIRYDVYRDANNAGSFVIVQRWNSAEAFQAQRSADHNVRLAALTQDVATTSSRRIVQDVYRN